MSAPDRIGIWYQYVLDAGKCRTLWFGHALCARRTREAQSHVLFLPYMQVQCLLVARPTAWATWDLRGFVFRSGFPSSYPLGLGAVKATLDFHSSVGTLCAESSTTSAIRPISAIASES